MSPTVSVPALPSEREAELVRRFTVTLNYLSHLAIYLRKTYGNGGDICDGLGTTLAQHRPYLKLQRRTSGIDFEALRRHLEIGWISEVQLTIPATIGHGLALRYTNAWAPIHAYYASYMLLQAWFDANAMRGLADDHAATLRSISAQIRDRALFPLPWSLLVDGNAIAGSCSYINEPSAGACSAKIEVLSVPIGLSGGYVGADFFARMGTWLRTTREARLRVREDEWKRKLGRKRIDPKMRLHYAATLHPTSLFECLWRLRIRSNYRSVETYLVTFVGDADAEKFHRALVTITSANLFLLECYVARMIGAAAYQQIVDNFLGADTHGVAAQSVGRRLDHVLNTARTPGAGRRSKPPAIP